MSDTETKAPIFWKGIVPQKCDLCSQPLRGVFIDGRVQGSTRFANMHPGCHRSYGIGIGPGKGQMFRMQADGRWLEDQGLTITCAPAQVPFAQIPVRQRAGLSAGERHIMPATITFADARALTVFHSMAEGCEEVQRDNGEPDDITKADALIKLIEATGAAADERFEVKYPLSVELPDDLVEAAEDTLENCLDNSSGLHLGDVDAEDYVFLGQIVIQRTKPA